MKNLFLYLTCVVILVCASQTAQSQTARQLYLGYENNDKMVEKPSSQPKIKPAKIGKPGAKVVIERSRNGKTSFVSPNSQFRSGDKIRLHFETNFDGYLAVLSVGSSGEAKLLFPYEGTDASIKPSKDSQIPKGEDWIVFDDKTGTEVLTVVMAKMEIALQANADLNQLSKQATSNRDLSIESGADATYAVCATATLAKPVGFTLRLKHAR